MKSRLEELLAQPWSREVRADEDGVFLASVPELEGCWADGDTVEEALASLRLVLCDWLSLALEQGAYIPEPRREPRVTPRIALRRDSDGRLAKVGEQLDDVVVQEVQCFRAEMLSDTHLWMRLYLRDTGLVSPTPDYLDLAVSVAKGKKKQLEFVVTQLPEGREISYEDAASQPTPWGSGD